MLCFVLLLAFLAISYPRGTVGVCLGEFMSLRQIESQLVLAVLVQKVATLRRRLLRLKDMKNFYRCKYSLFENISWRVERLIENRTKRVKGVE